MLLTIWNYLKRLQRLPWNNKFYYIINALVGEIFRRRTIGTLGFRLLEISLTDRCQCRCVHCYAETADKLPEKDELTTEEIKSVIDQAAGLHVTEICFSGGEPLLRDDILDLISYTHRKGIATKINTNGVLLTSEMVSQLNIAGLDWCGVSIDSIDPAEHDELRKYPGCFEKAIAGIRELVKQGIPTSVVTYVKKEKVYTGELDQIVRLGKSLRVSAVRINFPVPMGGFDDKGEKLLSFEEREEVRKLKKHSIVSMESPLEGTKCTAAVTKINILPNGDITPCVFVPKPYGNIKEKSFKEIWDAMDEFDKIDKPTGKCPMCDPKFREQIQGSKIRQC